MLCDICSIHDGLVVARPRLGRGRRGQGVYNAMDWIGLDWMGREEGEEEQEVDEGDGGWCCSR